MINRGSGTKTLPLTPTEESGSETKPKNILTGVWAAPVPAAYREQSGRLRKGTVATSGKMTGAIFTGGFPD